MKVTAFLGEPDEYRADRYTSGTVGSDGPVSADGVLLSNAFGATVRGTESRRSVCAQALLQLREHVGGRDERVVDAFLERLALRAKASSSARAIVSSAAAARISTSPTAPSLSTVSAIMAPPHGAAVAAPLAPA